MPDDSGFNSLQAPAEYRVAPHVPPGMEVGPPAGEAWQSDGSDSSGGMRRYFSALKRFKWLFLVAAILGGGVGYLLSRVVKLEYQVEATVWIDRAGADKGPISEGKLLDSGAWVDLLRTFEVLDYVVVKERLYLENDPSFRGLFNGLRVADKIPAGDYTLKLTNDRSKLILETKEGAIVDSGPPGDSLGEKSGILWAPRANGLKAGQVVPFTLRVPREVARELGRTVVSKLPKDGTFIRIELKGTDRERIAATINTLQNRFVDLAADLKQKRLEEFANILAEQLATAETKMITADAALENLRIRTITLPSESPAFTTTPGTETTVPPATASFLNMKTQQDQLRRDKQSIQRTLAQATKDKELSLGELESIAAVQGSGELKTALQDAAQRRSDIRVLLYKYTDEHPDVKSRRAELAVLEQQTIPALAHALVAEIDRRDAQLETTLVSGAEELRQIPPRVMEEARLKRELALAENIYGMLRNRKEEAQLAKLSSRPDLRIVDQAKVPTRPVADTRIMLILMSIGVSLGLVAGGIFLFDRLDRRVRFPEEVTHGLRLPVLAAIPRLKSRNGNAARDAESMSQVIEAFRGLRLRLLHETNGKRSLITAITSPGSGDGKSFVSVNLALAFADQGYRTLLIDGDVRRGGLHRYLGVNRQPGLTNLLSGAASVEQVVQPTSYPHLDLIGCGTRLQAGPELLGSPALSRLITQMRDEYTVILIDSPPLGAGVDPFVLGTTTGNLLIVLRAGYTDREFAEAKLSVLDPLPVRVVGAILNGVPEGGAYRYYSYISGYEATNEEHALTDGTVEPALR